MATTSNTIDSIVLWLSRILGVLNLPYAFMAVIDLPSVFLGDVPHTSEQWRGFITAITVLAGAIAGLSIKSKHSPNRKMVHLLIAAFGVIFTFIATI